MLLVAASFAAFTQTLDDSRLKDFDFIEIKFSDGGPFGVKTKIAATLNILGEFEHVKNEKGKPYLFASWAEVYDYFDRLGWEYFRDSPEKNNLILSIQIFKRKN